jgi:hypothetical protein
MSTDPQDNGEEYEGQTEEDRTRAKGFDVPKEEEEEIPSPQRGPLLDYADFKSDPKKKLLGERFLCTEGGLLFIGPSGIGKSSSVIHLAIPWSVGKPAFKLYPSRPLKIVIIQAEDDQDDIKEMVQGAIKHFKLTPQQAALSRKNCIVCSHKIHTGDDFLERVVEPILKEDEPDIIIINPLQAYLGADPRNVEAVSWFLRNKLNPLLEKYQAAAILVHHTPKTNFRTTEKWRATDWMYAGSGTAEFTQWARAVIIIEPTEASGVYRFLAAKRGDRTGWNKEGFLGVEFFAWGDGAIFWRDATKEEIKNALNPKTNKNLAESDTVLSFVPASKPIERKILLSVVQTQTSMGRNKPEQSKHPHRRPHRK